MAAKAGFLVKVVRLGLLAGCLVGGAVGGSRLFGGAKNTPAATESHPSPSEPIEDLIDRNIRAGEFTRALTRTDDLDPATAALPWVRFRTAVCWEGQQQWTKAADAYEKLTREPDGELVGHAALGLTRCRLGLHQLPEAEAALTVANGHPTDDMAREITRLRACLAYRHLGPATDVDPLVDTALAWPSIVDRPAVYRPWLPPVPKSATPGDPHPHAAAQPVSREFVSHVSPPAGGTPSRDAVRAVLRTASDAEPHPAAALVLANMDFADGRRIAAGQQYRKLLDASPDAPEAVYASYNLGLVLLHAGETAAARTAFLGVVDRRAGDRWTALGWYWIGRTHLDGGDATAAVKAFREAADSSDRLTRSAAELAAIVSLSLLASDDVGDWLARMRPATDDTHATVGEVFRTLDRYQTTPTPLRAEQVLEAIKTADDLRAFGPGGVFLAGRLTEDLGLDYRTRELYDRAAVEFRGPWPVRMTLRAAELYDADENRPAAKTRYTAVAAADPHGWGPTAEQKLAALAIREGNGEECIRRCLRLLDRDVGDRNELLRLLGRGYERVGDPAAAAECFAGRRPTSSAPRQVRSH